MARLTNKRYRSKSNMFDSNIHNFSSYTLNETEEFVLNQGLEFCNSNFLDQKKTCIFWIRAAPCLSD